MKQEFGEIRKTFEHIKRFMNQINKNLKYQK